MAEVEAEPEQVETEPSPPAGERELEQEPKPLAREKSELAPPLSSEVLPDDGSELLLLIDKFEELFLLVDDEIVRQQSSDARSPALGPSG